MLINILRVGVNRMQPDSFQWCPATGQGAMGTNLKHKKFHPNTRKSLFTLRVMEHWNWLPREVVDSPSLEIFKTHLHEFLCSLL